MRLSNFVILFTELSGPPRNACSPYQAEGPMRDIVLSVVLVALVVTGGVAAAWFITQPTAATYTR